jgi:hypothetical protein
MIRLKDMIREDMPLEEEDSTHEFKQGYKLGRQDYIKKYERDLNPEHLPAEFLKGYKKGWKEERRKRWWSEMNARMTDLLARMGSSRLR